MSFEAYKIAVKLSLVNNVSAGLLTLTSQFTGLNKHIGSTSAALAAVEARLAGIKRLGMVGGAMAGVGFGALALLKAPIDEAKKFEQEVARFGSLGFGDKVNREAVKFATGMQIFGTSARDNMTMVSDAMAVFKDLDHAKFAAPVMARMKFANEAVFGMKGGEHSSKFMDMLKVIEFRGGLSSEQEFDTQANFVQKVIAGSRNRVDASQMLAALKTGGVALSRRSNEQFYLGAEPLIQEFGGQRYGTGAMSIYQNLVQARGTVTAQQELFRLGLLDPKMVEFNSLGRLKKARPGAFKGSAILESEGELALLEKVLLPAFAAKGITSDEDVVRELGMIIGNRTGSGLMARIFQQRGQITRQMAANAGADNIDQLSERAKRTMAGKEVDLAAKWRDVLRELGTVVLPIAIKAVEGLTGVLRGATQFAKDFPTLTKALVLAGGALAVLVGTGGTLMLAVAGFRALGLALGILSLGGGGGLIAGAAGGLLKVGTAIRALVGAQGVAALASGLGGLGLKIASLIGPGSVLAAAGLVGYGVGTLIHKGIEDTKLDKGIGYAAARVAAFFGNEDARDALRITSGGALYGDAWEKGSARSMYGSPVKPRGGQSVQVTSVVKLNEREIARAVTSHQEQAAARPQGGSSWFDGGMMPPPVNAAH